MSRRRAATYSAIIVVMVLAAIPVTAYVIIPQFVRSTVVEAPPTDRPVTRPAPGSPTVEATSQTVASGSLRRINAVDFGSGRVSILRVGAALFLRFDGVEIAAAPAQHVYLSDRTDGRPGKYTDLGALKATSGSFNYEVPAGVDLAEVRSVVSWCVQFNTTVTYAVLDR